MFNTFFEKQTRDFASNNLRYIMYVGLNLLRVSLGKM